jgi:hypothetical protein
MGGRWRIDCPLSRGSNRAHSLDVSAFAVNGRGRPLDRSSARDTRAGGYTRKLQTQAGGRYAVGTEVEVENRKTLDTTTDTIGLLAGSSER